MAVREQQTPSARRHRADPAAVTRCCAPPSTTRVPAASALHYAPIHRALGDPTRLEILGLLAATGDPLCVCELQTRFDLTQPTISHHVRVLREAGLISGTRRGPWNYYRLERGRLREAMALLDALGG